jgi:hypothetical protein
VDLVGGGDEPCPEDGDCGRVEGEKMPERERGFGVADRLEGRFCWGCGGHLVPVYSCSCSVSLLQT